jgi:hypothetical protein
MISRTSLRAISEAPHDRAIARDAALLESLRLDHATALREWGLLLQAKHAVCEWFWGLDDDDEHRADVLAHLQLVSDQIADVRARWHDSEDLAASLRASCLFAVEGLTVRGTANAIATAGVSDAPLRPRRQP